ncbi:MAG: molybdenum cofactor biosynthesis protein MoaE [Acidimicrobiales bacterium]
MTRLEPGPAGGPAAAAKGGPTPADGDTWVALRQVPILVDELTRWVKQPRSGAVVTFCGCVRDHSPGRAGVDLLEYEAYDGPALRRMREVADAARRRWPALGRIAIVHRTGRLHVSDDAVAVAVSSPHRTEAFEAARYCIDTVKATVPLWKRERWAGDGQAPAGEDWGTCAHDLEAVEP